MRMRCLALALVSSAAAVLQMGEEVERSEVPPRALAWVLPAMVAQLGPQAAGFQVQQGSGPVHVSGPQYGALDRLRGGALDDRSIVSEARRSTVPWRGGAGTGGAKPRCVMLNAGRLDFDNRLDFGALEAVADVTRHEVSDPEEVLSRVAGHEIVVNKEMPLPGDLIRQFPDSVKVICEAGTGYNNIDVAAAREKGIQVCNIPTYATEAMAHAVITYVMALSCSLWPQAQALQAGNRQYMQQCHLGALPHFELTGKTLGLIGGLGTIGLRVASMATALGMKVVASSRSAPLGLRDDGVEVVTFEDLLERSDFVSVQCPLNAGTKGLVGAEALARMKPTAYLINTARGSIVDQDALVDALKERRIAGAALDVYGEGSAPPPALPEDNPLYGLDNVILTPHIGWQRAEARQRVVDLCAKNIEAMQRGEPINVVD